MGLSAHKTSATNAFLDPYYSIISYNYKGNPYLDRSVRLFEHTSWLPHGFGTLERVLKPVILDRLVFR